MYHKVGERPRGARRKSDWISPEMLRRELGTLKSRGYVPLLLSELRDAECRRIPMPRKPALITFDDGYGNQYRSAFPILQELDLKANVFLVCGSIGGDNRWDPGRETAPVPMLTWAQIRTMRDSGMVEFGSHTMGHPDLMTLPVSRVRRELEESKRVLEDQLGREALGFAYPFGSGAYDPLVRGLALEAGYRYDFGAKPGVSRLPWDPGAGPLMRVESVEALP